MRALRIHEAAATEAAEAAAWYEKERPGLGSEFERAIDAALDLLEQDVVPLVPMPGAAGARRVKLLVLRRFPYSVIVREGANEMVVHAATAAKRSMRRLKPSAISWTSVNSAKAQRPCVPRLLTPGTQYVSMVAFFSFASSRR